MMPDLISMPKEINKSFDTLIATSNNLLHGSLKENILFLHLFKCGGTSYAQAIKSCYLDLDLIKNSNIFHLNGGAAKNATQKILELSNFPGEQNSNDYMSWKFREYLLLYQMSQEHTNYIAGHFRFSEAAYQYFSDKYAFITVLRDPVERFISAYFYRRYRTGKLELELEEHLQSKNCLNEGSLYVRSLCGMDQIEENNWLQAIAKAKENLHKFRIIGFLEYQEEFLRQFEAQFNRRLKIKVTNRSPKSAAYKKSLITPEIRAKITEICQPDLEIYQYAINNFMLAKNN